MKQLAIKHPDKHVCRVGNKKKDVCAQTIFERLVFIPAVCIPPPPAASSARTVVSILKRKDRAHTSLPNSSLWNVAEDFWRILQVAFFEALYFHWHEKLKARIVHEADLQTYEWRAWISAPKPVNHNIWGAGACLITQTPNWPLSAKEPFM